MEDLNGCEGNLTTGGSGMGTTVLLPSVPAGRSWPQHAALGPADTFYVEQHQQREQVGVNMEIWIRGYAVTMIYCFGNYT